MNPFVRPEPPEPAPDAAARVLDTATLQRVGGRLGSNPAGVYRDEAGRRYYVKELESPALARNEWLAAQLYRLAGAPTLRYLRTRAADQVATEFVVLDKKNVGQLDEAERRQARRWLGVHAWTANWDAAGYDGDNQGVTGGTVLTLDVGGALEFRAQGSPKGRAFGHEVGELDRLRHDPDNRHASRLFGEIGEAELHEAITIVTRLDDAAVRACVLGHGGSAALAEKMLARKADMARRLGG
ncbi:hypothetical protein [Rubrivivax benzoatilyticus]|uniref:Uncharacterized protein n=1 Tax=Rubrivivax benzoatilyticus TaxID=316997 RepID=A0ABX0HSR6_9BURK|nr:hypothetical protein [Rubrivivax benzoatilyticus]EGJ08941.1 hypothetical protein RBXJA2T_01360 [Rubrivivax benzoatilyticus JA2 = ATCC BAA-35]NHK96769.1 hypothetical protein [Rubrivivax benzoatilyticus]NHL24484.1 hypothetical protein [Rubrivivax benzoatilyticus]